MYTRHHRLQKSITMQKWEHTSQHLQKVELSHSQWPNLLLTDDSFICFHPVKVSSFICLFIRSFTPSANICHRSASVLDQQLWKVLAFLGKDRGGEVMIGRQRDDREAKKPQGVENVKFLSWHSLLGVTVTLNTQPHTPEAQSSQVSVKWNWGHSMPSSCLTPHRNLHPSHRNRHPSVRLMATMSVAAFVFVFVLERFKLCPKREGWPDLPSRTLSSSTPAFPVMCPGLFPSHQLVLFSRRQACSQVPDKSSKELAGVLSAGGRYRPGTATSVAGWVLEGF